MLWQLLMSPRDVKIVILFLTYMVMHFHIQGLITQTNHKHTELRNMDCLFKILDFGPNALWPCRLLRSLIIVRTLFIHSFLQLSCQRVAYKNALVLIILQWYNIQHTTWSNLVNQTMSLTNRKRNYSQMHSFPTSPSGN